MASAGQPPALPRLKLEANLRIPPFLGVPAAGVVAVAVVAGAVVVGAEVVAGAVVEAAVLEGGLAVVVVEAGADDVAEVVAGAEVLVVVVDFSPQPDNRTVVQITRAASRIMILFNSLSPFLFPLLFGFY